MVCCFMIIVIKLLLCNINEKMCIFFLSWKGWCYSNLEQHSFVVVCFFLILLFPVSIFLIVFLILCLVKWVIIFYLGWISSFFFLARKDFRALIKCRYAFGMDFRFFQWWWATPTWSSYGQYEYLEIQKFGWLGYVESRGARLVASLARLYLQRGFQTKKILKVRKKSLHSLAANTALSSSDLAIYVGVCHIVCRGLSSNSNIILFSNEIKY